MAKEEDPEALRRRLYRPGASDEDRRRYLAALPEPEAESAAQAAAADRPRRIPVALPVAVLALVVTGGAVLARTAAVSRSGEPSPVASAASTAEPSPRTILPSREVVVAVDGTPRIALRVTGSGSADVPLDVTTASFEGGRLIVLLSSTDARPVAWRALTFETQHDPIPFVAVTATGPSRDREGTPRADVASNRAAPPTRLRIEAPADAVWTLTAVFDPPRP